MAAIGQFFADMTFAKFLDILKNITFIVSFLSIFIEITPLKFRPITWLFNRLFKSIRKEISDVKNEINNNVDKKFNELKDEVTELKKQQQDHEAKIQEMIRGNEMDSIARIRWEILEFSNSIENGQMHTRDEFLHVKDNYKRYHMLIEKNNMTNGYLDEEMKKIDSHYEENKGSSAFYI